MASVMYSAAAKPFEVISAPGSQIARAVCSQCGGHHEWRMGTRMPPERIHRYFAEHGWINRRRLTCPDCAKPKPKEPKMTDTTTRPALSAVPAPNPDVQKRHKRLVLLALEDCFDEKTMRYRPGHDDASVAKELDLAPAFVITVREEFFGKLAEPEGVAEMRAKIEGLTAQLNDVRKQFLTLCGKHGWS